MHINLILAACAAFAIAWGGWRMFRKPQAAANTYATALAQTHDGRATYLTDAAITTRYLLYKVGTDASHVAVAGATDFPIGTVDDEASAAEEPVNINFLCSDRTHKMVASGAITAGNPIFAAASGKVAATGLIRVGKALSSASNDGDVIEVEPQPSTKKMGTLTLPVFALSGVTAADIVSLLPLNFAGTLVAVDWIQGVPVTTGSKLATLSLKINSTAVTGGAMALTSATCTPLGVKVAGSAITAANTFASGDTLTLVAASVTAFSEGSGFVVVTYSVN